MVALSSLPTSSRWVSSIAQPHKMKGSSCPVVSHSGYQVPRWIVGPTHGYPAFCRLSYSCSSLLTTHTNQIRCCSLTWNVAQRPLCRRWPPARCHQEVVEPWEVGPGRRQSAPWACALEGGNRTPAASCLCLSLPGCPVPLPHEPTMMFCLTQSNGANQSWAKAPKSISQNKPFLFPS